MAKLFPLGTKRELDYHLVKFYKRPLTKTSHVMHHNAHLAQKEKLGKQETNHFGGILPIGKQQDLHKKRQPSCQFSES